VRGQRYGDIRMPRSAAFQSTTGQRPLVPFVQEKYDLIALQEYTLTETGKRILLPPSKRIQLPTHALHA
jgi:hypothetical protein